MAPPLRPRFHRSIHELDPGEWDAVLAPDRLFLSHAFLAALEDSRPEGFRFHYLAFRDPAGALVAHACVVEMRSDLLVFAQGWLRVALDAVRRALPSFLRPRVLEGCLPIGLGQPLSIRPGSGLGLGDLAGTLAEALEELARREGISMLVLRDFRDGEAGEVGALAGRGYHRLATLPDAELDLSWPDYESYLAAMRSRYRTEVRRRCGKAEAAGLRVRVLERFGEHAEALARQWGAVHEAASEARRERISAAFYRGLAERLPERVHLVGVYDGDELAAHGLVLRDDSVLRWLYFGREPGRAPQGDYFLVVQEVLRQAFAEGAARVELGSTTYKVKVEAGARMVPLWMFLRVRVPGIGRVFAALHDVLNPVPEPRQPAVFRDRS